MSATERAHAQRYPDRALLPPSSQTAVGNPKTRPALSTHHTFGWRQAHPRRAEPLLDELIDSIVSLEVSLGHILEQLLRERLVRLPNRADLPLPWLGDADDAAIPAQPGEEIRGFLLPCIIRGPLRDLHCLTGLLGSQDLRRPSSSRGIGFSPALSCIPA
jgi:hypothetical protein